MATKKITELPELSNPTPDDVVMLDSVENGQFKSKRFKLLSLLGLTKTIFGQSIAGTGNIDAPLTGESYVRRMGNWVHSITDVSELTDNTGILFDGDYDSLENPPTKLSDFENDLSFFVKKNVTDTEGFTNGALIVNSSNKTGEVLVGTDLEVVSGSLRVVRTYSIDIDFEYLTPFKRTAPFNMKINSIDKSKNPTMTVTITVNGSAYTLGTAINYKDDIVITTSIIGYLKLNCEKL